MLWRCDPLGKILANGFRGREFIGVLIGLFLGMLLMILSVEIYLDVQSLLASDSALDRSETLIVAGQSGIDPKTIESLKKQPAVSDVGIFRKNLFELDAYIKLGALGSYYTEMFFESVPDRFLDDTGEWDWQEGSKTIPIVIPNDFLTMYNFGFAPARGLPRITQESIRKFVIGVRIGSDDYRARVTGFTNRIQSIIVPEEFLAWANEQYAPNAHDDIRKLVVKARNPDDSDLKRFLTGHSLEIVSGASPAAKIRSFTGLAFMFTGILGSLITIMALGMYVLSVLLYFRRSEKDIALLSLLGMERKRVLRWLSRRLTAIFSLTMIIAFLVMLLIQHGLSGLLSKQGFDGTQGVQPITLYASIAVWIAVVLLNRLLVKHQISDAMR